MTGEIPKAELLVHLEGTAPPALVRRLAERNAIPLPDGLFADEDTFHWTDFLGFLATYDMAASAIRTAEDYRDVTYEYLSGCAAEGALYVELIASPGHADSVGLPDAEHFGGTAAARIRPSIPWSRRASSIPAAMPPKCSASVSPTESAWPGEAISST